MASSLDINENAAAEEAKAVPSTAAAKACALFCMTADRWKNISRRCRMGPGRVQTQLSNPSRASGATGSETVSADMAFRDGAMASVLLIEDDRETANEIRAELGDRGYAVDWAADGIEGLDKARSGEAEIIIVDRLLPGMDGLTIVEALRERGHAYAGISVERAWRGR